MTEIFLSKAAETIAAKTDLVSLVSRKTSLSRSGSVYIGKCPFHDEQSPSFIVDPVSKRWVCFGCGKSGDAVSFVMEAWHVGFVDALRWLCRFNGVQFPEKAFAQADGKAEIKKERLFRALEAATGFYSQCLFSDVGKEGLAYLKGRGLSEEDISRFHLGWAPGRKKLSQALLSLGYKREELLETGLSKVGFDEELRDYFYSRVTFPITNADGRTVGFGARAFGDAKPKYLNSAQSSVFQKKDILYGFDLARKTGKKTIILCEGYMDAISMKAAGHDEAVASLGTSLTENQCALIASLSRKVVIAYDSDEAGNKAAARAVPMLRKAGIKCARFDSSPCKDPDEFIKKMGKEAFNERLRFCAAGDLFETRTHLPVKDGDRWKEETLEWAAKAVASANSNYSRDRWFSLIQKELGLTKQDILVHMAESPILPAG